MAAAWEKQNKQMNDKNLSQLRVSNQYNVGSRGHKTHTKVSSRKVRTTSEKGTKSERSAKLIGETRSDDHRHPQG